MKLNVASILLVVFNFCVVGVYGNTPSSVAPTSQPSAPTGQPTGLIGCITAGFSFNSAAISNDFTHFNSILETAVAATVPSVQIGAVLTRAAGGTNHCFATSRRLLFGPTARGNSTYIIMDILIRK